jgi:hypothetical protein
MQTDYKIYREKYEVFIYKENELFLKLKMRRDWILTVFIDIYKDDELILKSWYNMAFFFKFCSIDFQKLSKLIQFKGFFKRLLQVGNDKYGYKWIYYRKKACVIRKNSKIIAELKYVSSSWTIHFSYKPDTFTFTVFSEEEDTCFYSLIRLLIELPILDY